MLTVSTAQCLNFYFVCVRSKMTLLFKVKTSNLLYVFGLRFGLASSHHQVNSALCLRRTLMGHLKHVKYICFGPRRK
jgi:hypothetical protein